MTFSERLSRLFEEQTRKAEEAQRQRAATSEAQRLTEERVKQEKLAEEERKRQQLLQEFNKLESFGSQNLLTLLEAVQTEFLKEKGAKISRIPKEANEYKTDQGVGWALEWENVPYSGNRIGFRINQKGEIAVTLGETEVTKKDPIAVDRDKNWRERIENIVLDSLTSGSHYYSHPIPRASRHTEEANRLSMK